MIGIVSFGAYIPKYRLKIDEIAAVWGKNGKTVSQSLGIYEKAVASSDEDTTTLAFEAARQALLRITLSPRKIGAIFVGSESHPYAVNPTATTVGEFLGVSNNYFASDLEFACKAGTTSFIFAISLVAQKKIEYGLAIGADCAQAKPHDVLEYTAASAACALVVSSKKEELIAEIIDYNSYSSDTPDFWRRDGISYPSHAGRFSGEPAYFTHVVEVSKILLGRTKMQPSDFSYCAFHMPNGKFPKQVAARLGFTKQQLNNSLVVEKIGNPYAASSLMGLSNILEKAKPNQYIFMTSYGSGAGADAFILKTSKNISKMRFGQTVEQMINNKQYISYVSYLKIRGAI